MQSNLPDCVMAGKDFRTLPLFLVISPICLEIPTWLLLYMRCLATFNKNDWSSLLRWAAFLAIFPDGTISPWPSRMAYS